MFAAVLGCEHEVLRHQWRWHGRYRGRADPVTYLRELAEHPEFIARPLGCRRCGVCNGGDPAVRCRRGADRQLPLRQQYVGNYRTIERQGDQRSEEQTSELQSLMRISHVVLCLKKKNKQRTHKETLH